MDYQTTYAWVQSAKDGSAVAFIDMKSKARVKLAPGHQPALAQCVRVKVRMFNAALRTAGG